MVCNVVVGGVTVGVPLEGLSGCPPPPPPLGIGVKGLVGPINPGSPAFGGVGFGIGIRNRSFKKS